VVPDKKEPFFPPGGTKTEVEKGQTVQRESSEHAPKKKKKKNDSDQKEKDFRLCTTFNWEEQKIPPPSTVRRRFDRA